MTDALTTLCTVIGAGILTMSTACLALFLISVLIDRVTYQRTRRDQAMTPRLSGALHFHDGWIETVWARSPREAIAEVTGDPTARAWKARAMARGVSR